MSMGPRLRKLALTVHLTFSVGWIGAVMAYLALVIAAMGARDENRLRAAWIAMEVTGWFAIVPLALLSLLTGLVMALGTRWGLFRHYWVVTSVLLTILANGVLLGHMPAVSRVAALAAGTRSGEVAALRGGLRSELLHAGVGLMVLLVVQVLNVYKPAGMTAFGRREQMRSSTEADRSLGDEPARSRRWAVVSAVLVIALLALLLGLHLTGGTGGMHRH